MKRTEILIVVSALVALAILVPFASSNPDGLEKVAESLNVREQEPLWRGLMPDYTLEEIRDPYLSTLICGVIGFFLVSGLLMIVTKTFFKE